MTAPSDVSAKEPLSTDVDYDAWFRQQVEEGLADMEAGRVFSHEEVMACLKEHIRALEATQKQ